MDEDFEVEVSDLRTGQVLKTARATPVPPAPVPPFMAPPSVPIAPGIPAHDPDFELEITTLPPSAGVSTAVGGATLSPSRPAIRRRQVYGGVATGTLIVIVLVAILGGVVSRNGLTFGLFPTPVPTAPLAIGADTFYMVDGVPWGKLLADGNVEKVAYSQQQPVFFQLPMGRHIIEYDAAPFPTLRCTVSVPAARSDTCPLYSPQDTSFESNFGIMPSDRGIDFKDTLSQLPRDQLQALSNVAEQSLNEPIAATTVPVGGRYQGANSEVLTAAQTLNAQVFFTLNTNASFQFGQNCISLCDLSFGNSGPNSGGGWDILANVLPMWRYTDPSTGATVELPGTPHIPGIPSDYSVGPSSSTFLSVSWTGAWQVTPFVGYGASPGCFGIDSLLVQSQILQNAFPNSNGYGSAPVPAPNPADGCLIAYGPQDQQGNLVSKPLWFLYRFGLIFAANPGAHKVFPGLPVAIGSEAELAKQLATQLQPPWNG